MRSSSSRSTSGSEYHDAGSVSPSRSLLRSVTVTGRPYTCARRRSYRPVVRLIIAACVLVAIVVGAGDSAAATYTPLPAHVYAPYYETYLAPNTPSIATTAQQSGAKYFTLAFLQTTRKGPCTVTWNGSSSRALNYYASDIAALRAAGGDVIPSFGGYSADQGGTEIADSCTDVPKIAAAYESVIQTLGVTRL